MLPLRESMLSFGGNVRGGSSVARMELRERTEQSSPFIKLLLKLWKKNLTFCTQTGKRGSVQ